MAYSKIILNGETLMDVTEDTVDSENLLSGETATKNSGAKVTGSLSPVTDVTVNGTSVVTSGVAAVTVPTTASDISAASSTHTHGNITNSGDITATAPTIASGDQIIINDNSANKITNGPTFDGSTTTKALTQKGTWETFLKSYTETDPVYSASAAAGISSSDITNWNGKTSNTGTVTSVRVQATSPVNSSTSTEQSTSLNTTISLSDGYGDTKNPYASKTKNYILAAPSSQNGTPLFRSLVASDIPDLSSLYLSASTTIPTITDTYSGTSSNGMSGKAVKSAIDALDGAVTGTAGSSKTLTAFSQTDGKVSATFGDISITKSQVSDFPTIPTVNNATLTIQKNGTTVNTFTANASSDVTANITTHEVPSGGTAGQVLSKNSGTDYDLTWASISSDIMLVTMTSEYDQQEDDYVISMDKTFSEIEAAAEAGKVIFLKEEHTYEENNDTITQTNYFSLTSIDSLVGCIFLSLFENWLTIVRLSINNEIVKDSLNLLDYSNLSNKPIHISTSDPTSNQGNNGDVWFKYSV